ncbi:predicted protein [Naegleria gruberi]|uniref:Predicted protein n=1 Tax=Naegleria gruberi TaxID=5762 RepID=D2VSB4_NAEGR|nr:uncharacterized protein NAEGRDRAFT_51867 [Naegleria gruberi]EFC40393.1 predicted protein [Naegleria gruberi]|eukprot:XP_002673137.1 predicted protein [Naegleria gruberi strain NEG-M]
MSQRPKRIIIQHNSLGTTLPSQNVDYSSSGLSGTSEDDIFFDSESYLSGDATIDRNSTVLRGGRRMNRGNSSAQQPSNVVTSSEVASHHIEIENIEQAHSFPPSSNLMTFSSTVDKKKKLRKKNLQVQQDQVVKKHLKDLKDANIFHGDATEEDYKSLFVIPHEEIWTTSEFRNVIEPALREFEEQGYQMKEKKAPSLKSLTAHQRYHKLVEQQAKEALNRQYDVDFVTLMEDILIPFINQRKVIDEENENKEENTAEQQSELVDRLKGNFMVLVLTDGHRRFLTHAICQFYSLKSFSTDYDGARVTVISKRRHLVESDDYPVYESRANYLSTYLAQFKQEKPSYMLDNDLFKHEGNEIKVLDKKSFVKHYRKKKKKQQE